MAIVIKGIRETVNISDDTELLAVPFLAPELAHFQLNHINYTGLITAATGYLVERRDSTMHELVFTLGGTGAVSSQNCTTNLVRSDLLVLPKHTSYTYKCRHAPWRFMWFQLSSSWVWRLLDGTPIHTRKSHVIDDLESTLLHLLNESVSSGRNASRMTTLLSEQVVLYIERELTMSESPRQQDTCRKIDEIWRVVRQNLDKNWTTRELADLGNMSESTFYRACLRHTGLNPHNILLKIRMQQAEQLLRSSDCPAKTIAEMVGYSTPFAFSHAFKRYKKMSPKAYRAQGV
jgi:AraC family transcriptional regulator, arabinose operon regulatory protein